MDEPRFDAITRFLGVSGSRRVALQTGIGITVASGLARLGLGSATAKNKKRKRRRRRKWEKLQKNEYGCVNAGGACRGNDANCCSGICDGKKPKQGKQDMSKCVAHHVLDCPPGADTCLENKLIPCGTSGRCYQTTGQASFCASLGGDCFGCTKDVECEASKGPGAACIVCPGGCGPTSVTTRCHAAAV